MKTDVTFVIPCLNEEKNVANTLAMIDRACALGTATYESLVIDDGSTDQTAQCVRAYAKEHPHSPVRLHQNGQNRGLGYSFWFGATIAHGECYMVVGGDNELPEDCVRTMLAHIRDADVVIASPIETKNRPLLRRMFSRTFIFLFWLTSGHRVQCVNTPMLIPTALVRDRKQQTHHFGYFAELLCDLLCSGVSAVEVPVSTIYRNTEKTAALRLRNFIAVGGTFRDLFIRRIRRIFKKR